MFEEERRKELVEYINRHQRASVQELSEHFQVSESTIRRDLRFLEEEKLLKRTHGGAIALEHVAFEPTFMEKETKFLPEKQAIAQKACELICEGDTILLDSGTTTLQLAKKLKAFSRLTVVTNSLVIAKEFQEHSTIDVHLLGGTLRKETLALVGPFAEQILGMINVDKVFIATNGLDIHEGLTTPNVLEAKTKRNMIKAGKEVILLTDHSKAGKVSFAKFADLEEIDQCIIDHGASDELVRQMQKMGINVHIVGGSL
ncbi:DeoR family transcriptional regulator [Caldalkalibacillus thermarum]|uniref:DeoR/GlpR family DNA-binding transcription regulator n=1 Tax=Caldalkalibacillus thermarum TaxID=296745 RepID=UPI00166B3050|nr:DeoR/GlpR family DNA-binding transcription regulator [Caldalkalibacillus thermarum]GGK31109.1 DeoR family transcriptional regulator [Caldalkalibacillus thermarum]